MNIFILRHGKAVERGAKGFPHDADRPLTREGRDRLRRIVKALKRMEVRPDAIFTSPYLRARQTAEVVAEGLGLGGYRIVDTEALAPGGSPRVLVRELRNHKPALRDVLLTGHEPDLSRLISLLATGQPRAQLVLKKGGLCRLSASPGTLSAGQCASLEWLLTPRQMLLMAQ
jgi:phosphohistidine phosphatase